MVCVPPVRGDDHWPSASWDAIRRRAQLLADLRGFFQARGIVEVDVPVLGRNTVTDPFIAAITTSAGDFLQTSPEYYMKRLLAAGAPSIYYLGKAFRDDERGRRHRSEFTLVEWYLRGEDDHTLIAQMVDLLKQLAPSHDCQVIAYGEVFQSVLGVCPYRATSDQLHNIARKKIKFDVDLGGKSAWLDLLFSHCVEPTLDTGFWLVTEYPAEQCALARVEPNAQGVPVARRFEVFGGGVELANGYWELTDADVLRARFEQDLRVRRQMGLCEPAIDEAFMAAMDVGLPPCAGVALGVDRLMMVLTGEPDIARVMPFANG